MSTVRINDEIKKEVTPILDDLGLSLSEAINIYLQSYICENGHLHNYNSRSLKEILKDTDGKIYNNVNELKKAMEDE